jgi:hypothetical protein
MSDALALLALPFAAAVVFVLIHAYLGVHVLRRRIVFADLALAQLSALGATVAFAGIRRPVRPDRLRALFTAIDAAVDLDPRSHALSARALSASSMSSRRRHNTNRRSSPQGAERQKIRGRHSYRRPTDLAKFVACMPRSAAGWCGDR